MSSSGSLTFLSSISSSIPLITIFSSLTPPPILPCKSLRLILVKSCLITSVICFNSIPVIKEKATINTINNTINSNTSPSASFIPTCKNFPTVPPARCNIFGSSSESTGTQNVSNVLSENANTKNPNIWDIFPKLLP